MQRVPLTAKFLRNLGLSRRVHWTGSADMGTNVQHNRRRHRPHSANAAVAAPAPQTAPRTAPYFQQQAQMSSTTKDSLTQATFASFDLCQATQRALSEVMGYSHCTNVQAESLPVMLHGSDVVCKAKTGTGKTLAFLIPGIERVLQNPVSQGKIAMLVLSPTRELAAQIAEEARQLLKFQRMHVQVMFGGTNATSDLRALQQRTPDILVATPGRLLDHLQNSGVLQPSLSSLRMLVLDEADRLLDMGFRHEIEKVLRLLPPSNTRQSVLFSATFPKNIKELAAIALRPQYELVDTVGEEETHAAEMVEQHYAIASMEAQGALLLAHIKQHCAEDPNYKVMAFFVTARVTQFYCELFQAMGIPVLEMHSRKSQPQRTRAAEQFRNSQRCIMFSSDVSARGVDYPDVSLVVQLGLPMEKAQYIHRLGRTARAGKSGKGLIILGDYETRFLQSLSDLPITQAQAPPPHVLADAETALARGLNAVDYESKAQAYRTWLGFYKGFCKMCGWDNAGVVAAANHYAKVLGCPEPPPIERKTVGKMGLKGVPGLNIVAELHREGANGSGGRQANGARSMASPGRPARPAAPPKPSATSGRQSLYAAPGGPASYSNDAGRGQASRGRGGQAAKRFRGRSTAAPY